LGYLLVTGAIQAQYIDKDLERLVLDADHRLLCIHATKDAMQLIGPNLTSSRTPPVPVLSALVEDTNGPKHQARQ
jgi:hypothetical protein